MVIPVKARLIYNPSAGTRTARDEIQRAVDTLCQYGWSVEIIETQHSGDATQLARAATQEQLDVVIAVGGDGTVNEVANGLIGSNTVLGVLPLGTANVWAKEMGLPLHDATVAAQRLAEADVRWIDVGEVSTPALPAKRKSRAPSGAVEKIAPRVFVLWCGAGLDALITRDVEPQREMKRRLGALMFWLIGIRDAWSYRGQSVILRLGGKRIRKRVILILACNVQLYGGIARIAPDAQVNDGLLDVVVLKGTGFWATAWHLIRVFFGAHVRDPQVEIHRVSAVTVLGKKLPVHVDAEPIGFAPIEITVRPRALRVLVPKTANKNLFVL